MVINLSIFNRIKAKMRCKRHTLYNFDNNRKLETVRYASSATMIQIKKVWLLKQVEQSDLTSPQKIADAKTGIFEIGRLAYLPEKLSVVALDPDALSISGLYQYVNTLQTEWARISQLWAELLEKKSLRLFLLR